MATQNVATKKRRAWTTSVFIQRLMAVSGFVFVFFLLFHSYGNLKMFLGAQVYNDYAHWLHEEAFVPIFPHSRLIWVFRAAMVLMLVIRPPCGAAALHLEALAPRPLHPLRREEVRHDYYAARTMRMSGVLILLILIFHIAHFTTVSLPEGRELRR